MKWKIGTFGQVHEYEEGEEHPRIVAIVNRKADMPMIADAPTTRDQLSVAKTFIYNVQKALESDMTPMETCEYLSKLVDTYREGE